MEQNCSTKNSSSLVVSSISEDIDEEANILRAALLQKMWENYISACHQFRVNEFNTWRQSLPLGAIHGEDWAVYPTTNSTHNIVLSTYSLKPKGCKTVFVGNLPKELSLDTQKMEFILEKVFITITKPTEIRVNPRGFAHVRFLKEEFADEAIKFTGYTLLFQCTTCNTDNILNQTIKYSTIVVDYSINKQDEIDWERNLMQKVAELEHEEDVITNNMQIYSHEKVHKLIINFKNNEQFHDSCQNLLHWLERTYIDKQVSNDFFTVLQSLLSHMKRLEGEKEEMTNKFTKIQAKYYSDIANLNKMKSSWR